MSLPQIISLFFLITGVAYFIESLKLPLGKASAPGAGFYPLLVGLFLTVLALSLFFSQRKKTEDIEEFPKGSERTRVIALAITLVLFVILLKPLGYIISTTGMLILIIKIFGLRKWRYIILLSIITTAISYYIFEKLMAIPFPPGLLTFI